MSSNETQNKSASRGQLDDSPEATALRHAEAVKQGGSPEALMSTMMGMLEDRSGQMESSEEEQFILLIQNMAARAEVLVRKKLAEQVAALPNAPRGLLDFLARDEIEVAGPLLQQSLAFNDEMLIEVIDEKGGDHTAAIARRSSVSKTLSGAIIDTGSEQAILILLRNAGAEIEVSAFSRIKDWAKGNGIMQQALIKREDLPTVIAQQVFWSARGGLRQQILERFSIRPGQLDILLEEAVADGLADAEMLQVRKELQESIAPNAIGTRVSVSEIINHVKAGRITDFVRGVASHLKVGKPSIDRIMADEGGEALAVLCRALDADRMQFTSVLLKNDYRRFGTPRPPGQIEQVSRIYDSISPDDALATVQMWDALGDKIAA